MENKNWIVELAESRYEAVLKAARKELEDVEAVVAGMKEGLTIARGRTKIDKELKPILEYEAVTRKSLELQESEDFKKFYIERVVTHMGSLSPFTLEYLRNTLIADKEMKQVEKDLYGDIESYITVATGSFKLDA